jgi:ribosomal protein S18 acetylase RimI-like enzyme
VTRRPVVVGAGGGSAPAPAPPRAAGSVVDGSSSVPSDVVDDWPFLRTSRHRWVPQEVWEDDGAAAVMLPHREGRMLVGVGHPARLAALLADGPLAPDRPGPGPLAPGRPGPGTLAAPELPADVGHVMLTVGTWQRLPADRQALLEPTRPWDWLATGAAPEPVPGEDRVVELTGERTLERVYRCLDAGYPERGRRTYDEHLTWFGYVDDDGGLAGVLGADVPPPADLDRGAGVHLEAVTVLPARRRRGVAAAMTAAATRWGLGRGPVVHLGIWSDNDAARRLYTRLGFVTGHRVENLRPLP